MPARHASCAALALVALCAAVAVARPAGAAELYGYVQEGIAVGTSDAGEVIFHRQLLNIKAAETVNDLLSFRIETSFWADEPTWQDTTFELEARLREAYAKFRFEKFDLRLGRAEIAWGEIEGIIVSDRVSPFDLENFIVPPFDEIRLGVDGAFLDYYFDSGNELQLIWIAHFTSPDFASKDSPWAVLTQKDIDKQAPPGVDIELRGTRDVNDSIENSEFGARFSGHQTFADWQVGYLRSWDDIPTVRLRPTDNPFQLTATPQHNRYDLFVAGITYPIESALLKFDGSYSMGRFINTDPTKPKAANTFDRGFVAKQDVMQLLVGVDLKPNFSWWEQADASFQFIHEQIIDPHPALAAPEHNDLVSLLLSAAYFNETVKPWLFTIANVRGDDMWVQARVDYEPIDRWRFRLEYDWFYGHAYDGDTGGVYGRFDDNDAILTSIRYNY